MLQEAKTLHLHGPTAIAFAWLLHPCDVAWDAVSLKLSVIQTVNTCL